MSDSGDRFIEMHEHADGPIDDCACEKCTGLRRKLEMDAAVAGAYLAVIAAIPCKRCEAGNQPVEGVMHMQSGNNGFRIAFPCTTRIISELVPFDARRAFEVSVKKHSRLAVLAALELAIRVVIENGGDDETVEQIVERIRAIGERP